MTSQMDDKEEPPKSDAMTTREAARYCGFSSPSGLLSARRRGNVEANGRRGGTGKLTWDRRRLDEFLRINGPVGDSLAGRDGGKVSSRDLAPEGRRVLRSSARHGSADGEGVPAFADPARRTRHDALETQAQLRRDGVARIDGRTRSRTLWSAYAASLFESKVTERKIKSAASRRRWADTLALLVPAFGMLYVDELRYVDLATWRDQVARWIRNGMPSRCKRDAGKNKLVHLSPVTANGWISILKVVCAAMTKHFELDRNPAAVVEYFPTGRTYTREQRIPSAIDVREGG
jgi:hypothetical protein